MQHLILSTMPVLRMKPIIEARALARQQGGQGGILLSLNSDKATPNIFTGEIEPPAVTRRHAWAWQAPRAEKLAGCTLRTRLRGMKEVSPKLATRCTSLMGLRGSMHG